MSTSTSRTRNKDLDLISYTDDFVYRTYHADFYHYRHSNLIDIVDIKAILKF